MQTDRRGRLYIHLPCSALFGRVGENRDKPKDGITSLFIYRVKRKKKKREKLTTGDNNLLRPTDSHPTQKKKDHKEEDDDVSSSSSSEMAKRDFHPNKSCPTRVGLAKKSV